MQTLARVTVFPECRAACVNCLKLAYCFALVCWASGCFGVGCVGVGVLVWVSWCLHLVFTPIQPTSTSCLRELFEASLLYCIGVLGFWVFWCWLCRCGCAGVGLLVSTPIHPTPTGLVLCGKHTPSTPPAHHLFSVGLCAAYTQKPVKSSSNSNEM